MAGGGSPKLKALCYRATAALEWLRTSALNVNGRHLDSTDSKPQSIARPLVFSLELMGLQNTLPLIVPK